MYDPQGTQLFDRSSRLHDGEVVEGETLHAAGPQRTQSSYPQSVAAAPAPATASAPGGTVAVASQGFGKMFGLDPRAAILVVLVDLLLSAGELLSGGVLIFFSFFASTLLGWIVYRVQNGWYHDDHATSLTKALIVGLVTAIPAALTPLIMLPGGIVGLLSLIRRKRI